MSKKALFDLLEEQHKFLSGDRTTRISKKTGKVKKSKSIYRETKSDKKPTVAGTNVDTLTEEVMAEIKRKNDIKESESLEIFKNKIKNWKPDGCECRLCKTYVFNLGFI